ncbi:hypothetical protein DFH06DRAFT_310483 [Mycena polygramma]|nr:hypothetical protein DFH06DRAFT_310483 [Mycena polygramma]
MISSSTLLVGLFLECASHSDGKRGFSGGLSAPCGSYGWRGECPMFFCPAPQCSRIHNRSCGTCLHTSQRSYLCTTAPEQASCNPLHWWRNDVFYSRVHANTVVQHVLNGQNRRRWWV